MYCNIVLALLVLLIAIADARTMQIPDELLLTGLLLYPWLALADGHSGIVILRHLVLYGFAVSLPLLVFVLLADAVLQRETMGGGDIKLFFVIGVYLGPAATVLTLYASCVAGLIGPVLQNRLRRGEAYPFGPYIALGTWLVLLYGKQIIELYTRLPVS